MPSGAASTASPPPMSSAASISAKSSIPSSSSSKPPPPPPTPISTSIAAVSAPTAASSGTSSACFVATFAPIASGIEDDGTVAATAVFGAAVAVAASDAAAVLRGAFASVCRSSLSLVSDFFTWSAPSFGLPGLSDFFSSLSALAAFSRLSSLAGLSALSGLSRLSGFSASSRLSELFFLILCNFSLSPGCSMLAVMRCGSGLGVSFLTNATLLSTTYLICASTDATCSGLKGGSEVSRRRRAPRAARERPSPSSSLLGAFRASASSRTTSI
mmetsp:Transcript_10238/g.27302  ORF Transcript_10238/g.27302 Transcript_10238/m.27302 type:complete len:272 (+) Transcript_10238:323-1138(+)